MVLTSENILALEYVPTPATLEEKIEFLKEHSLTPDIFNPSIPEDQQAYFELSLPVNQQVLIQPELTVKGKNAYGSYTFFNKDRIRIRKDGEFYHEDSLNDIGTQYVYMSFITPDNRLLSLKRSCVRLVSPPDFGNITEHRKSIIYFYNSRFFYDRNGEKYLNKPLSRADLAYFIFQYLNKGRHTQRMIHDGYFPDVPMDKWYAEAVNYCAENGYMKEMLDGHFKPAQPVSVLEYVLTMSKVVIQKSPVDEYEYEFIESNHWILPYLNNVISNRLIEQKANLNLFSTLSVKEFITYAAQLDQVRDELELVNEPPISQDYSDMDQSMIDFLYEFLKQRDETIEQSKGISFDNFKTNSFVVKEDLILSGIIFPIESFKINEQIVTPEIQGDFLVTLKLPIGESVVTVDALGDVETYHVTRLKSYENLEGHWFSDTASKLMYLGLLPDTPSLNSDALLTREEVAGYLKDAMVLEIEELVTSDIEDVPVTFDVTENVTIVSENSIVSDSFIVTENGDVIPSSDISDTLTNLDIEDLNIEDIEMVSINREAISYVVTMNVVALEDNRYYPKKPVLRSEAILFIMNAFYPDYELQDKEKDLPYWDVPKNHPSLDIIKEAYEIKLISSSPHLYPDRPITHAEFLTMISRVEKFQEMFKTTFNYD